MFVTKYYPSQENRTHVAMLIEYRDKVNEIADGWQREFGDCWTQKAVLEYLIDLAYNRKILPTASPYEEEMIGGVLNAER